jgi:MOB kinase activator 1
MPRDEGHRRVRLPFTGITPLQKLIACRFEYLWQDNENYKRPTKMPAPAYIEQLMTWVQSNIDNEQVLPSKIGSYNCVLY